MSDAHHDSGREYYWNAQPKPDKDRIRELEIQLKANSDLLEKAQARLDAIVNDRIIPIEYEIKGTREPDGRFPWRIIGRLQREGATKWVVKDSLGQVVTVDGELEWEPQTSSRDDDFLHKTRFKSPIEALAAFDLFMEKENSK